jgi:hypothetical protein
LPEYKRQLKSPIDVSLPIRQLFELETVTLFSARKKSKVIHKMQNIASSGNEVEHAVRDYFRRRLSGRCTVGNGHIVDIKKNVSPDFDLIIYDGLNFPTLQENRDGRAYFPYEGVFAFAEIKSTYDKSKKPIETFINSLVRVKTKLWRAQTPQSFVSTGSGSGINLPGLNPHNANPYLNPLFTFMLFVDSGDFRSEDVIDIYANTDHNYLPNIIVFLDKGCITLIKRPKPTEAHYETIPYPEFANRKSCVWAFHPLAPPESLAFLWSLVVDAISNLVLMKPHYLQYISTVFELDDKPLQILEVKSSTR